MESMSGAQPAVRSSMRKWRRLDMDRPDQRAVEGEKGNCAIEGKRKSFTATLTAEA